ncbi:hypothetical protein B0H13DRAFT_2679933 [Mycena leptocephala]|nr:hypothetical protein B0H13DRAFT_2679933 [Mycena leptocephala]
MILAVAMTISAALVTPRDFIVQEHTQGSIPELLPGVAGRIIESPIMSAIESLFATFFSQPPNVRPREHSNRTSPRIVSQWRSPRSIGWIPPQLLRRLRLRQNLRPSPYQMPRARPDKPAL